MTFRAAQGPVSHPRMLGAAAGFGAGLLGTAISFDGPPIGAYGCAWAGSRASSWARWASFS